MKASIHPLVQVNMIAGFLDEPARSTKRSDLPESIPERVRIMMILVPMASSIKNEKLNSPTRLPAATFAFKVLHKFADGTTQRKLQDMYSVRLKQLAAYITGRKYLGGADRKVRKCKASGDEASTSQ